MLVDVPFEDSTDRIREFNVSMTDPTKRLSEEMIRRIGGPPHRIGAGMFMGHLNFNHRCEVPCWTTPWEKLWGIDRDDPRWDRLAQAAADLPTYGVCDYPEQVVEKYPQIKDHPSKFWIAFTPIGKNPQNAGKGGGWRWHKWGEYIGDKSPQCEYLDDEPEIDLIYVFHVYELKETDGDEATT